MFQRFVDVIRPGSQTGYSDIEIDEEIVGEPIKMPEIFIRKEVSAPIIFEDSEEDEDSSMDPSGWCPGYQTVLHVSGWILAGLKR